MLLTLWLMTILIITLSSGLALAKEIVVERAWLEDRSGQMSWEEVQRQPAQPINEVLSAGYGTAPVWLKVHIDPASAGLEANDKLVLRIRPAYLDEVTLFDPLQSPIQRPPMGDHYPASAQTESATAFVHHLVAGAQPRDLWLRVHTQSARLVYAEVMTPQAYELSSTRLKHLSMVYLGLVALFLLWGLIQTVAKPEPLMFAFILLQSCTLLMGLGLWGYSNQIFTTVLEAQSVDFITNAVILASSAAAVLFSYHVLNEIGPSAWRNWVLKAILALYPVLMAGLLTGFTSWALQMNMTLVLLVPPLLWTLAAFSPSQQPNERRKSPRGLSKVLVLVYFSITLIFTLLTAAPALGLIQGAEYSLYVVFMYSIASGILMVLMLQYRAWLHVQHHGALQAAAHQAAQISALEQRHREDRERLLAMLGHEIKTPLATLRMLLANRQVPEELSKEIDRSVTNVAQVVERALQSGFIENKELPVHLQKCDLDLMIHELCQEFPNAGRVQIQGFEKGKAYVQSDPSLLRPLLHQLLDNALKYSPIDSIVQLQLQGPDKNGRWSCTVMNQPGASGLPDSQRLFSKYYRSPHALHVSGAGLGLFVARGLARRLGGELHYQHANGLVCFCLTM